MVVFGSLLVLVWTRNDGICVQTNVMLCRTVWAQHELSMRRACTAAAESRPPGVPVDSIRGRSAPRAGPAVRVQLTVHGGMDLRLTTPSANARHRRVPSHEALSQMAAQHRTPVSPPKPAGIAATRHAVIEVTGAMHRLWTLSGWVKRWRL